MNSTSNSTLEVVDEESAGFYEFMTTYFRILTTASSAYLIFVILVVWYLKLYTTYPSFALRWILYLECIANAIVGMFKWNPYSPFHDILALNPNDGSCYFTIIYDTFISMGIIFLGTVAALSITELASPELKRIDTKFRTRLVTALFWIIAAGLSLLNISDGYVITGWCNGGSKIITGFKMAVAFTMFAIQILCLVKTYFKLRKMNKLHAEINEKSGMRSAGLPPQQIEMLLRFLVIILSQGICWVPLVWAEFVVNFVGAPSWGNIYLLCYGFFIGAFMDGTAVLLNSKVRRAVSKSRLGKSLLATLSLDSLRNKTKYKTQRKVHADEMKFVITNAQE